MGERKETYIQQNVSIKTNISPSKLLSLDTTEWSVNYSKSIPVKRADCY